MSFYCVKIYICILAWAFSSAKETKSNSRRLPALEWFYRETRFSLFKSTHSTKNLKTKLRTFPRVSRVTQVKFEANLSRGSWVMIGQTNRQTDKKILQFYIYCRRFNSNLIASYFKSFRSSLQSHPLWVTRYASYSWLNGLTKWVDFFESTTGCKGNKS